MAVKLEGLGSSPIFTSPTLSEIEAAARRLAGITIRTPLLENARVNAMLGGRLLVKAECLQRTGSFKFRGAYNFLASLKEVDRKKGAVGWSSGNHAQGLGEAARLMGMRATIVMPADAPALKISNTRASGALVLLHDRVKESRQQIGCAIARKTGAIIVPPYDHGWILTGQGTVGLEIVQQAAELGATLDAVVAPCSGGGLASGIALAVKSLSASTQIHTCEPAGFDDMARSLAEGEKRLNERLSGSICDALLAKSPGDITFSIARQLLDPGLVVTDDEVLDAMETAFREFKLVVEPSGAVALAAALTGKLPVRERVVAVVCSGGNVDAATFMRALGRRSTLDLAKK